MYRKVVIILLLAFSHLFVSSQTVIEKGGDINSDQVWDQDTIKIVSDLTILDGVTLTIESGAVVVFQEHYKFNVQGQLIAEGSPTKRIEFTSKDIELTDESGGWHGIRFNTTPTTNDTSIIAYCDFFYGNAYGTEWLDQQGGVIAIKDFGKVIVKNNKFLHSKSRGENSIIYIRNSSPIILGNLLANNEGTGIEIADNADPLILNNTIVNNTAYGINRNTLTPIIKNCIVVSNQLGNLKEITNQGNYISYSNIKESDFSANGNIDIDPKFENEILFNYWLLNTSPCIDAGGPNIDIWDFNYDIIGNDRVYNGLRDTLIDMGAYEITEEQTPLFTVNPDTLDFGDVYIGATKLIGITITNNEAYPITIESVVSNDADISLLSVSETLQIGEHIVVDIQFLPKSNKDYSTLIIIESNYKKKEIDTVFVLGKGMLAPTLEVPIKKIEETLSCVSSVDTKVSINNSGSGSMEFTIPIDFFDDFESGLNNWVYDNNWNVEEGSYDESFALTESLNGNYENSLSTTITLKDKIDIFIPDDCVFSFMLKSEMETCCDYFTTEIRTNNNDWIELSSLNGINDWQLIEYDLSSYVDAGDSLRVRFLFNSDYSNNFDGILIDDVSITGTGTNNVVISPVNGVIEPGGTEEVEVSFNANGIASEVFATQFRILSNDPLNKVDTLTGLYNIDRFSTLTILNNNLDFSEIKVLLPDTMSCEVNNNGCDTLLIDKIFSNNDVFWVDTIVKIQVPPYEKSAFDIIFTAKDSLLYNGKIFLVKSDETKDTITVDVQGSGSPYPLFTIDKTNIDTSLFCDSKVQTKLIISNQGTDTLIYNIPTDFIDEFDDDLAQWDFTGLWGVEYDLVSDNYFLSDSPDGDYEGNASNSISTKEAFLIFDTSQCRLSYNIKYDIEECCDFFRTEIQINSGNWELIDEVSGNEDWLFKEFSLSSHITLGDSIRIRFQLISDASINKGGVNIDDIKLFGSGVEFINIDEYSGIIPPKSDEELLVTYEPNGDYIESLKVKFRIESNDPYQFIDTIYCNYSIDSYSSIELLHDSLIFDDVEILQKDTLVCNFFNKGCDTLVINKLTTNDAAFEIIPGFTQKLAPLDTGIIQLVFLPVDSLYYIDTLTIFNTSLQSDSIFLVLIGNGKPYPVLTSSVSFIDTSLLCSETVQSEIILTNTGTDTLVYSMPQDFTENFETELNNWVYDGDWGIIFDPIYNSFGLTESLNGEYGNDLNSTIALKESKVVFDTANCTLTYQLRHEIENCCDFLYTELNVNNGEWITLDKVNSESSWQLKSFDLSEYVSPLDSINIRFRFVSDYTNAYEGAVIDNIKITGTGTGLLTANKVGGEILPGNSDTLLISFDASTSSLNKYQNYFQLFSNSPFQQPDSILFMYNIINMSSMNLITDSLEFNSVEVLNTDSLLFKVYNVGCDTLKITDIYSNNEAFSLDPEASKIILPSDTVLIKTYFNPLESKMYEGQLAMVHSGIFTDTTFLNITGLGKSYPKLTLNRTKIDTVQSCGTAANYSFLISNEGSSNLEYYIPMDFYDDFENELDNWETTDSWDIIYDSLQQTNVLTESPNGNYQNSANEIITLKNSIIILDTANCKLSFNLLHEIEECCDYFTTEIKINNQPWNQIYQINNSVDWHQKEFDLSTYVNSGDSIKVRFSFSSDIQTTFNGVMIDDVVITGACSSTLQLSSNRGIVAPNESELVTLSLTIPLSTHSSFKGDFVLNTNDPYRPIDTISYYIKNIYKGIDIFLGGGRSGAISFVLDSIPYVGLGVNDTSGLKDFWKFDFEQNMWVEIGDYPGLSRVNASVFVLNNKAYVGLGFSQESQQCLNDFYCFNPVNESWLQIADFGGEARSNAASFQFDELGYVGSGINYLSDKDDNTLIDFWCYNPELNQWDTITIPQVESRNGAQGFTIYDKTFVLGGVDDNNGIVSELLEYRSITDNWVIEKQMDSLQFSTVNSTSYSIGNSVYFLYGDNQKVISYNPQKNEYINYGDTLKFNNTRLNPVSFVLNDIAYFGLGKYLENKVSSDGFQYPHEIIRVPINATHSPTNINLTDSTVDENNFESIYIGKITTDDKSLADDFEYYVVEDSLGFYTAGDSLMIANLDYEKYQNVPLTLRSVDNEENFFEKDFLLFVNDIAEAPYAISFASDTVKRGTEVGTLVGIFNVYDQDTLDSYTLEFDLEGGELDSKYYRVIGDSLLVNAIISGNDTIHTFNIKAIDSSGLSVVSEFNVAVIGKVGISQVSLSGDLFQVYPNPAASTLNIELNNQAIELIDYTILSISGEIVKKQLCNASQRETIFLDDIESGVYLLLVNTNEGKYIHKIIVEK